MFAISNGLIRVIIQTSGGSGAGMAGRWESDERSFLSLRIKHSESDLTPKGPMQRISEYLLIRSDLIWNRFGWP